MQAGLEESILASSCARGVPILDNPTTLLNSAAITAEVVENPPRCREIGIRLVEEKSVTQ